MRYKQWSNDASKFPALMAMRIEFAAQIIKQFWNCGVLFLVHTAALFTLRTFGAQSNWCIIIRRKVLFASHHFLSNLLPIHFAGESGNEIRFSMLNSMFKTKIELDIDLHGPRLMPKNPPISRHQLPLNEEIIGLNRQEKKALTIR
jgi:hypothetical protein